MPKFNLYAPGLSADKDKVIKDLYNAYVDNTQQLQWLLHHLNQDNIQSFQGVNGTDIFTRDGINPLSELWSPNMWCNSDACIYDPDSSLPRFVAGTGVVSSYAATYVGQKSFLIPAGITMAYTPEAADLGVINPEWIDIIANTCYLAFYAKFTGGVDGSLTVEVYDQDGSANLTIEDVDGNTGSSLTFTRGDWDDEIVFVKFNPGASTDIRPKITNNDGAKDLYINAPQVCADVNGVYAEPYLRGKYSVGTVNGRAVELISDIAIYVQDDEPTDMVDSDLWINTKDYSTYDKFETPSNITLEASGKKYVRVTGTTTVTLFAADGNTGVIRKILNAGTGLVTLDGNASELIGGELTLLLYPGNPPDSVEIICNGAGWDVF